MMSKDGRELIGGYNVCSGVDAGGGGTCGVRKSKARER